MTTESNELEIELIFEFSDGEDVTVEMKVGLN